MVVDADGTVVKRVDRDTWGRVLADSAPAFALPIGFAGGIEDPDTGLVRFGMRDYDPQTGRFTARDPLFHSGSPGNLFAYADSSPASRVDPSGMISLGASAYAFFGGGAQASINWETGIGWCTETGGGAGAGVDFDLWGNPSEGQSYFTEAGAEVLGLGITLGADEGLCPPKGSGKDDYTVKLTGGPLSYKKSLSTNDYTAELGVGLEGRHQDRASRTARHGHGPTWRGTCDAPAAVARRRSSLVVLRGAGRRAVAVHEDLVRPGDGRSLERGRQLDAGGCPGA